MNDIIVLSKRDTHPEGYISIDTTSRNTNEKLKKGLSPFYLGPVQCYDDLIARNVENAWQYSKLYEIHLDETGYPNQDYFKWRDTGFNKTFADRYPMGKGKIPKYTFWKNDSGNQYLGYIEARKQIYIPLYAKAVVKTPAYAYLESLRDNNEDIALVDFDGYNYLAMGLTLKDVINSENKKMGHAFVLAMLLQGELKVENNKLIDVNHLLE